MPDSFKRTLKYGLQHIAARFGPHTRQPKTPRLLVLMYHRVLPADDERVMIEEPGMMVTPHTFRLHLGYIKQHFEVIRLVEWLERSKSGELPPAKYCVITFDDGWSDNYEFAYPILREFDMPATVFLVSGMIGTPQMFWPERLARTLVAINRDSLAAWSSPTLDWLRNADSGYPLQGKSPDREVISRLIARVKLLGDEEIHRHLDKIQSTLGLSVSGDKPSLLDWEQVAEMTGSGLVDTGSHTCHHIRLNTQTPDNVIEDEIVTSKDIIRRHTGHEARTFCFPNGDYSPRALELVRNYYEGAVTTRTGWNMGSTDDHLLRRVGVHEDIASNKVKFLARISGWM